MNESREEKSKTQIKKEAQQLQKIGEQLLALNPDQLVRIAIPDDLRQAVLDAKSIRSNQAKRRQIQYIGALMRNIDPEPVLKAISLIDAGITLPGKQPDDTIKKQAKSLIDGDDTVFHAIVDDCPALDRQRLRHLIRNAQKKRESPHAKKTFKALADYLNELVSS